MYEQFLLEYLDGRDLEDVIKKPENRDVYSQLLNIQSQIGTDSLISMLRADLTRYQTQSLNTNNPENGYARPR